MFQNIISKIKYKMPDGYFINYKVYEIDELLNDECDLIRRISV